MENTIENAEKFWLEFKPNANNIVQMLVEYANLIDKTKQVIPYQLCPKCHGDGNLLRFNSPALLGTMSTAICDVCVGDKIIPMYIEEKQKMKVLTDARDNKTYPTYTIGKQTWMAANLAFKVPTGCWAYDNDEANVAQYGYLYNWDAAKAACPKGWHLPTDEEWQQLMDFLEENAGRKLINGDFKALPGGYRDTAGSFTNVSYSGCWWSATESGANAWDRYLNYTEARVSSATSGKAYGFSVRCIKD